MGREIGTKSYIDYAGSSNKQFFKNEEEALFFQSPSVAKFQGCIHKIPLEVSGV
tara:strand:+ start:118 stop:279 length:162 start_codon:yes stop_codon:yes gene_type:complete